MSWEMNKTTYTVPFTTELDMGGVHSSVVVDVVHYQECKPSH